MNIDKDYKYQLIWLFYQSNNESSIINSEKEGLVYESISTRKDHIITNRDSKGKLNYPTYKAQYTYKNEKREKYFDLNGREVKISK